jgi:hypothetical protein
MKNEKNIIESKVYYAKYDNGLFVPNGYTDPYINVSKFFTTYKHLIYEWDSSLFTPFEFLNDVMDKINRDSHERGLVIEYSLSAILNISEINWKYYQKFLNVVKKFENPKSFKFFIIYFRNDLNDLSKLINVLRINNSSKKLIFNFFKNNEKCPAANFINEENPEYGCSIVLNGSIIEHKDNNKMEFYLDHEINHYFDKFNFDEYNLPEELTLNEQIKKLALKVGYSLEKNSEVKDFTNHILKNSEILEMCGDVVNALKLFLNDDKKYEWFVEHCTSKFISSNEYCKLRIELQNILLFGTILRVFSGKRWTFLLNHLKTELNVNEKIIDKGMNSIKTFFERLKSMFL